MAQQKIFELTPKHVETIDEELQEGIIYISNQFNVAIHLCCCGCKQKTVTPFNDSREWNLTDNNGQVTLRPSIGNFSGENPYHAHYYITDNKVQWL